MLHAGVDWATIVLDVLFAGVFVLAALHGRRLVVKEAPLWDYSGFAASWALALAWAFDRLDAALLAWVLILAAIAAVALPVVRGVRRLSGQPDEGN